jgi:hypothetical protein
MDLGDGHRPKVHIGPPLDGRERVDAFLCSSGCA